MSLGATVQTAHTADLDAGALTAARELLVAAFDGDIDEHDWEHCLGGVHALAWQGEELVGHAAVVQRRLVHGGRALRTGYVEGVGVHPDHRGRGHGAAVMAAVEHVVRGAYDLGALASSDEALAFYAHRGWLAWRGPAWAITPDGVRRTPDADGAVFVLPVAGHGASGHLDLDLDGDLTCDWRDGDVW